VFTSSTGSAAPNRNSLRGRTLRYAFCRRAPPVREPGFFVSGRAFRSPFLLRTCTFRSTSTAHFHLRPLAIRIAPSPNEFNNT
jgi:hypothetical protein